MASISQLTARLIDLFGSPATANPSKLAGNLTVSPNGNILVGQTTDNGTDKLQVTGTARFTTTPVYLSGPAATYRITYFQSGTSNRWGVFTDNTTETGSNVGSNFNIGRYNDAGTWIDNPISINRANGQVSFPNLTQTNGGIQLPNGIYLYALDSGGTSRPFLQLSGDNHPTIVNSYGSYIRFVNQAYNTETFKVDNNGYGTFNSGFTANGASTINSTLTTTGSISCGSTTPFHSTGDIGISWTAWNTTGGPALQVDAATDSSGYMGVRWTRWGERHLGAVSAFAGGTSSSTAMIVFNFNPNSTQYTFYESGNATFGGTLTQNSDYRIKTNVQTIEPRTALNNVLALRPVTYDRTDTEHDPLDHSGFIAHEIQEVLPNLVKGEKDAVKVEKQLVGDTRPFKPG